MRSILGEIPDVGGMMPRSAIRCRTLATCRKVSVISWPSWKPLAWNSSATCSAWRALVRLTASSRRTVRRANAGLHQPPDPAARKLPAQLSEGWLDRDDRRRLQ